MRKLLFLSLLSIGILSSCKDDDQDTNILPEATQSGANTGGALVDGNIWVAKKASSDLNGGGVNATQYVHVNNEYKLQISLGHVDNYTGNKIIINIKSSEDFKPGTYELYQQNGDDNSGYYYKSPTGYVTNDTKRGSLTITKFDKINNIVSGTFYFTASDILNNANTVTITDGRFDKKFIY